MTRFLTTVIFIGAFATLAFADDPAIPDPALTPGAVATTDQTEVCAIGTDGTYSRAHRRTPAALKAWIFREYGIAVPHGSARAEWEVDHLIPLCLGGADVAANLWPQSAATFHEKDKLEAYACRAVCAGRVPLTEAQGWFVGDWRAAYQRELGQ